MSPPPRFSGSFINCFFMNWVIRSIWWLRLFHGQLLIFQRTILISWNEPWEPSFPFLTKRIFISLSSLFLVIVVANTGWGLLLQLRMLLQGGSAMSLPLWMLWMQVQKQWMRHCEWSMSRYDGITLLNERMEQSLLTWENICILTLNAKTVFFLFLYEKQPFASLYLALCLAMTRFRLPFPFSD
jgi:hypothetical protein